MKETTAPLIEYYFKEETANAFKFKIKDAVVMVATHALLWKDHGQVIMVIVILV